MRSITTTELPRWFDLAKYQSVNHLDLDGWLINFVWRATYINALREDIQKYRDEIENTFYEKNGNLLIKARKNNYDWKKPRLPRGRQSHPDLRKLTVRSLEVWKIALIINWVNAGRYELSKRLIDAAKRIDLSDAELDAFMNEPFDILDRNEIMGTDFGDVRVEVDLFAPDKLILEDFKHWLAAARSVFEIPTRKMFSKSEVAKWADFRLLPYLDLSLWAALEQVIIPYAVLGNALFPDEYDVDLPERIRRVTKPKAEWAIQWQVIEAMRRQLSGTA